MKNSRQRFVGSRRLLAGFFTLCLAMSEAFKVQPEGRSQRVHCLCLFFDAGAVARAPQSKNKRALVRAAAAGAAAGAAARYGVAVGARNYAVLCNNVARIERCGANVGNFYLNSGASAVGRLRTRSL